MGISMETRIARLYWLTEAVSIKRVGRSRREYWKRLDFAVWQ
jgi:hypothetical protein